jgi:TonB family protein
MKKVIVFLFLLTSLKSLTGQEYFNRKWERCSVDSAFYFVNTDKTGGNSHMVRFKQEGRFSKDYAIYKTDDFKTGEFTRFNKKGDTLMHMFYKDGKLNGKHRLWKERGHLYRITNFVDDTESGIALYFFPNGQLSARYEVDNGKTIMREYWNEDGSELNDPDKANVKPRFLGKDYNAFTGWVASRLVYPNELRGLRIKGVVMVSFKITEKGYVRDVKALKSPHYLLAAEAVRVIENSPAWTPGISHNQVSEITFCIPVIF